MDPSLPAKKFSILASCLTAGILLVVGLITVFAALVALNGVMDSRASVALGLLAIFMLLVWAGATALAGRLAQFLQERFQWRSAGAVAAAIFSGTLLGSLFFFFSILGAILLAGIQ